MKILVNIIGWTCIVLNIFFDSDPTVNVIAKMLGAIFIAGTLLYTVIAPIVYSRRTFVCTDCGKSFKLSPWRLFRSCFFWSAPYRIENNTLTASPHFYSAGIKCPSCHSHLCGIEKKHT